MRKADAYTTQRARKNYFCFLCKEPILKGQEYQREEGYQYCHVNESDCVPTKCIRCRGELFREHGDPKPYWCYDCHMDNLKTMLKHI